MGEEPIRDEVRRRYAAVAVSVRKGGGSSCCGSDVGRVIDSEAWGVDWTAGGYLEVEKRELPQAAVEASLGCGNPVALATLSPGEVVLDLGSDVRSRARRVRLLWRVGSRAGALGSDPGADARDACGGGSRGSWVLRSTGPRPAPRWPGASFGTLQATTTRS